MHLLASSALPFLFPAVEVPLGGRSEFFGDGSMRQTAPISPVIHLGAERIAVIGTGRIQEPPDATSPNTFTGYPSMAQIAGHALSSIFLDTLATDTERMRRINQTLALIPPEARAHHTLRPIELLCISPSQRIDVIAARYVNMLPRMVRMLFRGHRGNGAHNVKGAALASYLLFEAPFTRELIELGHADALRQRDEIVRFFGWDAGTQQQPAG
jgi:NTE family protein